MRLIQSAFNIRQFESEFVAAILFTPYCGKYAPQPQFMVSGARVGHTANVKTDSPTS